MQEAVCGTVSNLDELYSALKDLLTSKDHLCMRVIKHDHFMLTPDVVASQGWNHCISAVKNQSLHRMRHQCFLL
jgi:hypothetical protein